METIVNDSNNSTHSLIYTFYIGWLFWNLTPKIKNFKFLLTDLFLNRQNLFYPAQFPDSVL